MSCRWSDRLQSAGYRGSCDVAEIMYGVSSMTCPADGFEPGSTVCRGRQMYVTWQRPVRGVRATCPADVFEPQARSAGHRQEYVTWRRPARGVRRVVRQMCEPDTGAERQQMYVMWQSPARFAPVQPMALNRVPRFVEQRQMCVT